MAKAWKMQTNIPMPAVMAMAASSQTSRRAGAPSRTSSARPKPQHAAAKTANAA